MLNACQVGGQGFEEGIVELAKDRLGDLVVRIDGSEKDDRLGDKVFHFGQGHTISELDVVAGNDDSRDAGFEGGFAVIAIVSQVVDQHFAGVERGLKIGQGQVEELTAKIRASGDFEKLAVGGTDRFAGTVDIDVLFGGGEKGATEPGPCFSESIHGVNGIRRSGRLNQSGLGDEAVDDNTFPLEEELGQQGGILQGGEEVMRTKQVLISETLPFIGELENVSEVGEFNVRTVPGIFECEGMVILRHRGEAGSVEPFDEVGVPRSERVGVEGLGHLVGFHGAFVVAEFATGITESTFRLCRFEVRLRAKDFDAPIANMLVVLESGFRVASGSKDFTQKKQDFEGVGMVDSEFDFENVGGFLNVIGRFLNLVLIE